MSDAAGRLRAILPHLKYLRLSAFAADTDEGRTAERYRLAALGVLAMAAWRLAGMALIVLTIHWAAPMLGPERFGVWATFSGVLMVSSFLDLGIGNAIVNRVAHAAASGNSRQLNGVVMGGLGWLVCVGACVTLGLVVASMCVNWAAYFKLSSTAAGEEARTAAFIFSGLFGFNILATGLPKVLIGQQRSYEAHGIGVLGALLATPVTWWAVSSGGRVGTLLLAGFGTQAVALFIPVVLLLRRRCSIDWSILGSSMREQRRPLFQMGAFFFLLQVTTVVGWGGDTLLLAGVAGASDVAAFAIAQRLFLFASQPVAILNGPLWAAYADAHARGDRRFILETLRRSFVPSVTMGLVLALLLLLLAPWIIPYWTHGAIRIPQTLLIVFTLWIPFECGGIALSAYLNGTAVVKEQAVVAVCFCLVAIPAKVFATIEYGATGLVAATTITYALIVVGGFGTIFRRRILAPLGLE